MAKDMTLLWGSGSTPCWRVMITLQEKKLQGSNQKRFSFEKKEYKSGEVMAITPGDQFKSQGNQLIPDSPAEKAVMYQRMMKGNTFQQKLVEALYYNYLVPEGERHDSAIKRHQEALTAELRLWDGYMKKVADGYMAGKSFSLADVAIFPIFACVFYYCPPCETRYPHMAAYYNRLKDRPSIKATWPPARFENPERMEYIKNC